MQRIIMPTRLHNYAFALKNQVELYRKQIWQETSIGVEEVVVLC